MLEEGQEKEQRKKRTNHLWKECPSPSVDPKRKGEREEKKHGEK